MAHHVTRLDGRSLVQAALFDLLFASGDRHLEHVLLPGDGSLQLIDNAHAILDEPGGLHQLNSVFLPGTNFHARNTLGFAHLHCCTLRNTCPQPKPPRCPERHTMYWPALPLDYRCHVPRGRIGHALPPKMRRCLTRLAADSAANLSARYAVGARSRRLERLRGRARLLLEHGVEGMFRRTDHSHGYYKEGDLHNDEPLPPPCCALTLDAPTDNRQSDEWRCHAMASEPLLDAQRTDGRALPYAASGAAAALADAEAADGVLLVRGARARAGGRGGAVELPPDDEGGAR
jgi:hypothetical protein